MQNFGGTQQIKRVPRYVQLSPIIYSRSFLNSLCQRALSLLPWLLTSHSSSLIEVSPSSRYSFQCAPLTLSDTSPEEVTPEASCLHRAARRRRGRRCQEGCRAPGRRQGFQPYRPFPPVDEKKDRGPESPDPQPGGCSNLGRDPRPGLGYVTSNSDSYVVAIPLTAR